MWDSSSIRPWGETTAGANRRAVGMACRRRASVLILVVTLLGILFVTGMTFLATVNFEADKIAVEQAFARSEVAFDLVDDQVETLLREELVKAAGVPFGTGAVVKQVVTVPGYTPVTQTFYPASSAYAVMPDVNPLVSQVEPYVDATDRLVYGSFVDLRVVYGDVSILKLDPPHRLWQDDFIDSATAWQYGDQAEVDSDGDGIADTRQFDLLSLGFSAERLDDLRRRLNVKSNPTGGVYLGLRVLPHGAFVNLSESHPLLVRNLLSVDLYDEFEQHRPPYSPLVEETLLRRRGGLLAPRVFSPSALFGNPLDANGEGVAGGDLEEFLLPQRPEQETVGGDHRYWPYDDDSNGYEIWTRRVDPNQDPDDDRYDLRQLVTTVSYDSLLSRGGQALVIGPDGNTLGLEELKRELSLPQTQADYDRLLALRKLLRADMREVLIAANRSTYHPDRCEPSFEYADYPQSIANGTASDSADMCTCPTKSSCVFNVRKGRLLLSLPWLDQALAAEEIDQDQQISLIQDAFMLMLSRARGAYWDLEDSSAGCPEGEVDNGGGTCIDPTLIEWVYNVLTLVDEPVKTPHRLARISRTAAALTANLLDYADDDDEPTRVPIRSYDFGLYPDTGADDELAPAVAGQKYLFGKLDPGEVDRPLYMYGVERQPYFSELAVAYDEDTSYPTGPPYPGKPVGWAIELVNPYDETISTRDRNNQPSYYFVVVESTDDLLASPPGWTWIELPDVDLTPGKVDIFYYDDAPYSRIGTYAVAPPQPLLGQPIELDSELKFKSGDIIYLVRRVLLDPNAPAPYEPGKYDDVVVDQFTVPSHLADSIAVGLLPTPFPPAGLFHTSERYVDTTSVAAGGAPWRAPIPRTAESDVHTLGIWNLATGGTEIRPVEIQFADVDSEYDPDTGKGALSRAFPTTGSLLLLLRHANRSIYELTENPNLTATTEVNALKEALAFTTALDDGISWNYDVYDPATGGTVTSSKSADASKQIDNGRMPVFDVGGAHHADPTDVRYGRPNVPGELPNLPWGQLVFDYFTALPLQSYGPYVDPKNPEAGVSLTAPPRVDQEGLRVHGRINLNAAPWRVLAGLPLMPAEWFPEELRTRLKDTAALLDSDPAVLGNSFAQAIVAYREAREIVGTGASTGDYGLDLAGRGWDTNAPVFRRGTGFLSIGELANVRHDQATPDWYRVDSGELKRTSDSQDYIDAIALLVALGDWVTVRSDVYTVYGTFRGDPDPALMVSGVTDQELTDDVDARALRFQETLDRLPTFLGEQRPVRIGPRQVGRYNDVAND